ncbi:hypothetical protein [Moheibacter sediminis]|uniref:Uncharacterized protein n=1 Tax=Moheibacter sediminis TaxID=1434700 RepID=A0A1W1Z6B7_9FLAO|nr:hypothetical protein [Moheibacter sediminis]SMC43906.1 hypothetical protein SAMN06296427_102232 [Moheibacter sediminis]
MNFRHCIILIFNLFSGFVFSQVYDTIVYTGSYHSNLYSTAENEDFRNYYVFDEKPLNAVVLKSYLDVVKIKEVYENGWQIKNDTAFTNRENNLFEIAKSSIKNGSGFEKSVTLIINKVDSSQLLLFFNDSKSTFPDIESGIIFKDKNQNECFKLEINYSGFPDKFESNSNCISKLFEIKNLDENILIYSINGKTVLKEFYMGKSIEKRQIFFPTKYNLSSIININYENGMRKEIFETFLNDEN